MDATDLVIAALGIALGGFLKGATGAGAPIVGVPILALAIGVPNAVAIFSVLNLFSNTYQSWTYRADLERPRFAWRFAWAGAAGAVLGTFVLASLPTEILLGGLASIVFAYILLRLARPDWRLDRGTGERWGLSAGLLGGVMQGAGGLSAPVSVTYLNAMRLERSEFIATISIYFAMMSVLQIPTLILVGLLDLEKAGLALLATLPLFAAIPLGEFAARSVSKHAFDRVILGVLALVAARLAWMALT